VNTVMNPRVPQKIHKFLNSYITGGFSRRSQRHGVSYFTDSSTDHFQYTIIVVEAVQLKLYFSNKTDCL
jgi:hypothetical protein